MLIDSKIRRDNVVSTHFEIYYKTNQLYFFDFHSVSVLIISFHLKLDNDNFINYLLFGIFLFY